MHLFGDYTNGNFFRSLGRRLHLHASVDSLNFINEIKEVDEGLTTQLQALIPKERRGPKLLRCSLLSLALSDALSRHVEAVNLIPPADLSWDSSWINEYMDQTARMLDVGTVLTGTLSSIEQSHLLIGHACHNLFDAQKGPLGEDHACTNVCIYEGPLVRAQKSLRKWMDLEMSPGPTPRNLISNLQEMVHALGRLRQQAFAKGHGCLYVVFGANVIAVLAFYMLSLALSEEDLLSLNFAVPPSAPWASSISQLVHLAKNEVEEQKASGVCLEDLRPLRSCVEGLLRKIEQVLELKEMPLSASSAKQLVESVNALSSQMGEIGNALEMLRAKLDEMFSAIVLSRSVLLDKLGATEMDH
ncbi:hypothetical protein KP509_25G006400 [Ceratopteris richardii]|uniref:Uncharacterized protein n=2 Tax=Ceratopteris richardii TaxID=49495 RepID=A0A8T2RNM2_CERRI|nr:hypothetical protein KP509_25G006400 [Ceratopteris richardii]